MDISATYTIAMFALGFSVASLAGVFILFGRLHDKGLLDKTEPVKKSNKNGSLFRF